MINSFIRWIVIISFSFSSAASFGQHVGNMPEGVGKTLGDNFKEFLSTHDHARQSELAQELLKQILANRNYMDFILWSLNSTIEELEKTGDLNSDYEEQLKVLEKEIDRAQYQEHVDNFLYQAKWMLAASVLIAIVGGSGRTLKPITPRKKPKVERDAAQTFRARQISANQKPLQGMIFRTIKPASGQTLLKRALLRAGFTRQEVNRLNRSLKSYSITGTFDEFAFQSTLVPGFRMAPVKMGETGQGVDMGYFVFEIMVPKRFSLGSPHYFVTKPMPFKEVEEVTTHIFSGQVPQQATNLALLAPQVAGIGAESMDTSFMQRPGEKELRYTYSFRRGIILFGVSAATMIGGFYITNGHKLGPDQIETVQVNGTTLLQFKDYNEENIFKYIGVPDPFEEP